MDAVKPTIFVVEDDPDISRLVRHHLEAASFNVRLYSTGNLVMLDAERQRPSMFLLDIMVPGKDGLELCRQIRTSVYLSSVPVIFLTAKSSEADRVLGLELGADDYVTKPFNPREVVARVRSVLRRSQSGTGTPRPQRVLQVGDLLKWRRRGLRMIGLTYGDTKYGHGVASGNQEYRPGGLTADGFALLDAMAGQGLIWDISHLAE